MWVFPVLVLATLSSWLLGIEGSTSTLVGCAVLAIALVKVRLVGLHFMELRDAPAALRGAFEVYVGATGVTLLTLYLFL
ncbi:cytochrome C oxidase subunit IV family protein [Streptomyces arenae]|uniref:cytochrome C oxidase subunit IV family protein n=1 Tax=Streptomyces arenae TaxID=29301 RepID=UPI00265A02E3|nr:cytochrome C oxidase subunit IV family protein [Streptomyces arenae]MCG7208239.1 cytochrome C oxidase subunit IV family protein [Streptomyces arenae]